MSRQTFFLFLILVAIAIISWQFVWPAYGVIKDSRAELATWETKLNDANASKEKLKTLEDKYNKMGDDALKVLAALPTDKDIPELLVEMEALTSKSGLVLNSIVFGQADSGSAKSLSQKNKEEPKDYKTLRVDATMAGDMASLGKFLEGSEKSLRLMDVKKVNFSTKSAETALNSISVSLDVYYK